jgi:CspA family cold shock protein
LLEHGSYRERRDPMLTSHRKAEQGTIMDEGTIKTKTDRGFGFIKTSSGQDLFFHMSAVEGSTFDELEEGQRVSYQTAQTPKGPRAEVVRPL